MFSQRWPVQIEGGDRIEGLWEGAILHEGTCPSVWGGYPTPELTNSRCLRVGGLGVGRRIIRRPVGSGSPGSLCPMERGVTVERVSEASHRPEVPAGQIFREQKEGEDGVEGLPPPTPSVNPEYPLPPPVAFSQTNFYKRLRRGGIRHRSPRWVGAGGWSRGSPTSFWDFFVFQ